MHRPERVKKCDEAVERERFAQIVLNCSNGCLQLVQ